MYVSVSPHHFSTTEEEDLEGSLQVFLQLGLGLALKHTCPMSTPEVQY